MPSKKNTSRRTVKTRRSAAGKSAKSKRKKSSLPVKAFMAALNELKPVNQDVEDKTDTRQRRREGL